MPQKQDIMCLGEKIDMGIRALIIYVIGIIVTYFIIKLAVKNAINECLEDIGSVMKKSIVEGLSEYEYKKQNKE